MMSPHAFSAVLLALPFALALEAERPKYTLCGSRGMEPCAQGLQCIDNPYRPPSQRCGMSCDIPGICVPQTGSGSAPGSGAGATCGGFKGSTCGGGLKCVQVQGDEDQYCNDCVGICV